MAPLEPPTGVVSLVFTDIEGYSGHSERHRAAFEPIHRAHYPARETGDRRGVAEVLNNLGLLADFEADLPASERFYRAALEVEGEQRNRLGVARALHNLGEVAERNGDRERAVTCFTAAHHLFTALGSPYGRYSLDFLRKNGGEPVAELDTDEAVRLVLAS